MKFLVIILFVLINIQVFPQEERPKDVPDFSHKGWTYIEDKNVTDTIKLIFIVDITFLYPISDTTQPEIITSINLYRLVAIDLKTNTRYFDKYYYDEEFETYSSDFEKYMVETYKDKLEYWSRHQSYRKLIPLHELRFYEKVNFGYPVHLVPKNPKNKG